MPLVEGRRETVVMSQALAETGGALMQQGVARQPELRLQQVWRRGAALALYGV